MSDPQPAGRSSDPWLTLPLRPKTGDPNALPVHRRLLFMLAFLIALILGVALAVALYTVYVKPMEHLLR